MLPEKVDICGIPHKVIMCEDHFDADTHFGQIDYLHAEIRINKDAAPEMQKQILFHEMLHGMLVMIGRNDLTTDETLVNSLPSAMFLSFDLKHG